MWMSHSNVAGVVTVADSAFYGGWDTLGWVVAAAPVGPPVPDAGWPVSKGEVDGLVDGKIVAERTTERARDSATYALIDGRIVVAAPIGTGGSDTAPIVAAIAAAKAAGGRQVIQLQRGVYSVNPGALVLDFNNVTLRGFGIGATQINKTGNGDLITITCATGDAGVVERAQVTDMRIDGKDFTGNLIRSMYSSQCHIKNVECYANNDAAINLVRAWDTVLDDVLLDHCGSTDGTISSLWIRNSGAASGTGLSAAGQTNMIYVRALRVESFRSAITVERGPGSGVDPYGIYFHGLKCETYFARLNTVNVINVRGISFRDVDLSLLGLDSGAAAVVGFNWAPLFRSKLDGIRINSNTGVIYRAIDSWLPGSGSHEIANVSSETSAPGDCVIKHNTANPADIRGCTTQSGTLHGGTPPAGIDGSVRTNAQAANYTLTAADNNSVVEFTKATAGTITIPPNSAVPYQIGATIEVQQYGAGQVTLTPGAGVTIRTASSLTTRALYSTVSLRKRATDEWVAAGDLS
jgi:hypothetical protein